MTHAVEDLLKMLRDNIEEAFTFPLGRDKAFVDKDTCVGLIDEIIGIMPGEIRKARTIVENRNELVQASEKEAKSILRSAQERAARLVSEQEVYLAARKKAEDLESQTNDKTREVRNKTNKYVDDLLARTETAIGAALSEIRQTKLEFRDTVRKEGGNL